MGLATNIVKNTTEKEEAAVTAASYNQLNFIEIQFYHTSCDPRLSFFDKYANES